MCKNVCRAITFINYHIPIRLDEGVSNDFPEYTTIGFFDGMLTERLKLDYASDDLKVLWKYSLRKTAENRGYYSFQNIFGFSDDEWNQRSQGQGWTDEQFWSKEADERYPLAFVVFLQLKDYVTEQGSISKQCKAFNGKVDEILGGNGISYTYGTVDKNDFIVCVKCRRYEQAVSAIKALHATEERVIYSYSIFSVRGSVLRELGEPKYGFLFKEQIASICLKGITNSYDSASVALDRKYRTLCGKLVEQLYEEDELKEGILNSDARRLYDILGDNDFRLIARNVNLGKLLRQYAPEGVLSYSEKKFPYYLFSSNLVLNTLNGLTDEEKDQISDEYLKTQIRNMEGEFVSPRCDELVKRIPEIQEGLQNGKENEDEKIVTFCHALFQLIQSLKVLESAPTKKYDFLSLYSPFEFLVQILEEKLKKSGKNGVAQEETIYEFIHTISMTLHGILRTDIQFFQTRDFNAIVHYAPAKLRAYYAAWTLKLKDFYKGFGETPHQYSFVFAPGMYKGTSVKELFTDYREQKRLMLMTVPERHLYIPRWLIVVIAHEVSHFVGRGLRERRIRHELLLKMSARILKLEFHSYMCHELKKYYGNEICEVIAEDEGALSEIESLLMAQAEEAEKKLSAEEQLYKYHSMYSKRIIEESCGSMFVLHLEAILGDYKADMQDKLIKIKSDGSLESEQKISEMCGKIADQILGIREDRIDSILLEPLDILRYIMSETFADIIAVLTLELSPEDYISSFEKTELGADEINALEEEMVSFPCIRIAMVVESIDSIVREKKNDFEKNAMGMCQQWGDETLEKIKSSGKLSDIGKRLVDCAICYQDGIRDWKECILDYERRYQPRDTVSDESVESGFLKDREIWNSVCEYLKDCGTEYIDSLKHNEEQRERREELLRSYKHISKGTEIDLMEEIENFLAKWEQES